MDRLKTWRVRRPLTQQELGLKSGVSPATISAIEEGVHLPRISTIRKLAKALGAEPTEVEEFTNAVKALGG